MTDTDWLAVSTIGAALLGFLSAWFGSRKERRAIRELHEKVGNGFATEVTTQLGAIASSIDVLNVQVGVLRKRMNSHISQHAMANKRKP